MSLLLQIALGALIAGGIGFGVWNHNHHEREIQQPPATIQDHTSAQVGADVNLSVGTTDADLDADMSSIDNQLKLVNESSVESDQSMNDKPITQ